MNMSINMNFTILAKTNEPEPHVVASLGTLEQLTSDQHHIVKTDLINISGIDSDTFCQLHPTDSLSINGNIKLTERGFEIQHAKLDIQHDVT